MPTVNPDALIPGEGESPQSADQLRKLAEGLHLAREEERSRIARELHDELGQALTAIRLEIACVMTQLPGQEVLLKEKLQSVTAMIDSAVHSVRRISTELRPAVLELGLVAAIEWQAREFETRTGIACELHVPSHDVVLPGNALTAIFRIFQESLTNVARHSGATRTWIILAEEPGRLFLEVRDNGRGMAADPMNGRSLGLLGMRERAISIGGELTFRGRVGEGTVVKLRTPVKTSVRMVDTARLAAENQPGLTPRSAGKSA